MTLRASIRLLKKRLYGAAVAGSLRPLASPAYKSAQAVELAVERLLDRVAETTSGRAPAVPGDRVTALIKTFERPAVLRRLVRSIRTRYPDLPIIVADDSREPQRISGVEVLPLPYNVGTSAGRNAGLSAVRTPYVLLLDDDYVFYRRTDVADALQVIEAHKVIDILGGRRIDLPTYTSLDNSRGGIYPTESQPVLPSGTMLGGAVVQDRVANFFIARTERLSAVGWDPELKLLEHADFFTRARGVLTTAYYARFRCLHAPTLFDAAYVQKRHDFTKAHELLQRRYPPRSRNSKA